MANIKFSQFTANAGIDGNPSVPAGSGNSFLVGYDSTANSNNYWSFPQIAEGLSTHIPTIYTANGTLAATRTVTMNAFDLNFVSTTAGQQVSFEQNVKVGGQGYTVLHTGITNLTFNWDDGNVQQATGLTGSLTFTPSNPENGATYIITLAQTGAVTATWTGVSWPAATPPTLSGAGKTDIITLICYDKTANSGAGAYYGSATLDLA